MWGHRRDNILVWTSLTLTLWVISACQPSPGPTPRAEVPPEPPASAARPSPALVRVAPSNAELAAALATNQGSLLEALGYSLAWFDKPSSQEYFPMGEVAHAQAWASVYAFRSLVVEGGGESQLADRLKSEFDFYSSVGGDGRGSVLFTGYYSPVFRASRTRTDEYRYPLFRRPDDLVVNSASGEVLGRRIGERIVVYPDRAEIETSGMLAGTELVWLLDRFEAYLIHVQGSAALALPDGSTLHAGYDGNNGHAYSSVSLQLVADGKLPRDQLSLDEVRDYFARHPEDLDPYLRHNARFIFFKEDTAGNWPAGSLGVRVTAMRSLATDKDVFPPGGVVLAVTAASAVGGGTRRFTQFMLDQDTGGAIRSAGRADIYYGIGREAEALAGGQYAEGRLYYLFLKPERVSVWERNMRAPP